MPRTVDELLAVAILCVTVLGTLGVCYLIIFILQRLDRRYPVPVFDSTLKHLRAPALLLVPTLAATTALAFVDVGAWLQDRIRHGL
ncbi:MAG TPA: hypothetical protein VLV87_03320, partial [Gammaproteobacteria bacterium]|nr:hypothetical protein [Gammaproteobacteria bacterium]